VALGQWSGAWAFSSELLLTELKFVVGPPLNPVEVYPPSPAGGSSFERPYALWRSWCKDLLPASHPKVFGGTVAAREFVIKVDGKVVAKVLRLSVTADYIAGVTPALTLVTTTWLLY
jgi:hypothetical protein